MRSRSPRRGGNAIEFALLAPVFLLLTLGGLEHGIYFLQHLLLRDAARSCARAGAYRAGGLTMAEAGTAAANGVLATYTSAIVVDPPTITLSEETSATATAVTCTIESPYVAITGFSALMSLTTVHEVAVFRTESWPQGADTGL